MGDVKHVEDKMRIKYEEKMRRYKELRNEHNSAKEEVVKLN